jgi:hypothetical protein
MLRRKNSTWESTLKSIVAVYRSFESDLFSKNYTFSMRKSEVTGNQPGGKGSAHKNQDDLFKTCQI